MTRQPLDQTSVPVQVAIPLWVDRLAQRQALDLSAVLEEVLKQRPGATDC